MVRRKVKWSVCFCYLIGIASIIHTLPLDKKVQHQLIRDSDVNLEPITVTKESDHVNSVVSVVDTVPVETTSSAKSAVKSITSDLERNETPRNQIRPGLVISEYDVQLTISENTFQGRVVFRASVTMETRNNPLILHASGLTIQSVVTGSTTVEAANAATFKVVDDARLEIKPARILSSYVVLIEYSGNLGNNGEGLYKGNNDYIGMNLSPTHARRVFPCIDELTESPRISLKINGIEYENRISNSIAEENEPSHFKALQGIPNRLAFIGNNFQTYTRTANNVLVVGRPGISGQENLASVAISAYYEFLNEWTSKDYFQIIFNQATEMHIIAIPDLEVEWDSLSIVGVWEPYMMMESQHAVKQRQIGLMKIAEAMARPWFGYALSPRNWKYDWITSGLMTYVAYEAAKQFQSGSDRALDYDTLFITEVLQESLYHDGYTGTDILEPTDEIFDENRVRLYQNGPMKFKAPSILYMLRHAINKDTDYVQDAARGLFINSGLETITSTNFFDILADHASQDMIGKVDDFIKPYIQAKGCPLLSVNVQGNSITISRSTFSFGGTQDNINYNIPITFTSEANPNFNDVFPSMIYNQPTTLNIPVELDEEQWIIFNIQGHGYYRVQYSGGLWERIINALDDDDRRSKIHPLNRATLLDDSLNLARRINSGLDYDIALRIVLTMSHETEYSVWKAYLRNMNFIKKHLQAKIESNEGLEPDIYARLIRKTVNSVETELGFSPDTDTNEPPMTTLTRAMVMDHACRAGYETCTAAAIDWFYGTDGINPDIPKDLKPAVYCAVVKDGNGDVRQNLTALLQNEDKTKSMYDRLVILEALACSQDDNFIKGYLDETIAANSPYSIEEKNRIFTAIVESSFKNAKAAFNFLRGNINEIRTSYGGSGRIDRLLFVIADNTVHANMVTDFQNWVDNGNNNLMDSAEAAQKALERARENMEWNAKHLNTVYEWIVENDSTTATLSVLLIVLMALVNLLF